MALTGTVYRICYCRDPDTGRALYRSCPDLGKRDHGTWQLDVRVPTTGDKQEHRLRRAGYDTKTKATAALGAIEKLLDLAEGDPRMRARIGDLIVQRSKRGGKLPGAADVRRKLGAGGDLAAPDATVGEWLDEWLAGKRRLKESVRVLYQGHIDHYFKPLIGDIPRDKLRVEHVAGVFDTIEEWNAEIIAAKAGKRKPYLPDDKRIYKRVVDIASQHRILATLRGAYNVAVKRPGMTDFNPCLAVELEPEVRDPARVWSPPDVVKFLEYSSRDRLGLLWRILVLRGPRRGEAIGMYRSDLGKDKAHAPIRRTVLCTGVGVRFDTPKTQAGERVLSLDSGTAAMVPGHLRMLKKERLRAGEAYVDHDLLFCRVDGTPLRPDWVTKEWRRLCVAAQVPSIRLHEARHTAATLGLEAGLAVKVVSDQLGHANTRITEDLYMTVRQAVQDAGAEQVLTVLPEVAARKRGKSRS